MLKGIACLAALTVSVCVHAEEPDYRTIHMEIEVAKQARDVWARVGKYCDIGEWMGIDCKITAGDGGIGTVRELFGGRITEILIGKTDLSYGYVLPAPAGQFDSLYHGFLEAQPVSAGTSKLVYTLFYDVSDKADAAARDADVAQRRARFEAALQTMKRLAETG